MIETPADILEAAADELDARGWQRHHVGTNDGPKCAIGAINFVATGDSYDTPATDMNLYQAKRATLRARAALCNELDENVAVFNDKTAKDKRYVTRAMRRTAKKLRESGQA